MSIATQPGHFKDLDGDTIERVFLVKVRYLNRRWTHTELCEYIAKAVAADEGQMHPDDKPEIVNVEVGRMGSKET
jgi:hypothetical protein